MNWLSKFIAEETAPQSPTYDANALILNIRTTEEFASGHVDGDEFYARHLTFGFPKPMFTIWNAAN